MATSNTHIETFLQLVDQHRGILVKVARSYTRTEPDREDLEQDMVAHLWTAYPDYDPQRKFSTWMYRIALNVAISWFRREQRRGENVSEWTGTVERTVAGEMAEAPNEKLLQLRQFLQELPPLDRALMLLYLDRYAHEEIADTLGISISNVSTRIYRIKKQLQQQFNA